jgi:hypothetical protein
MLVASLLLAGLATIAAQEQPEGPPKVLTVIREFVKPGKGGMIHEKSESAFVQAFARAQWPTHYLAVTSMSGAPRALFLIGYDSFAAWEKDNQATEKNAALTQALDRAGAADGELLSEVDGGTSVYRPDYSLRPPAGIAHMRYFEISVFHVRQGHDKDWDDLVKMVIAAYEKIPDAHWVTYEVIYGQQPQGTFIVFTPLKSLAEVDQEIGQNKQFEAAMGEVGMKRFRELSAAAIESSQNNLFQFAPKMSYPLDAWVKADPDFWKPKPAGAPAASPKKTGEKPPAKP